MLRVYNIALGPLRLVEPLWAALRARDPAGRREWDERRARRLPDVAQGGLWLHGSSVGEAALVGLVAAALRRRRPDRALAVSAFTPSGRARLPEPPAVDAAFYAPLDFPGRAARLLERMRPAVVGLIETELWPNLLHDCRRLGVPVAVLNARLSPRRMRRYRRLGALYRPLLSGLGRVGAQSEADAGRYAELGVPAARIEVTGNLKYDLRPPDVDVDALRERLGIAAGRPVIVAGSTGDGEEEQVLDALERSRRRITDAFLVLAPRHPRRSAAVGRLAAERGLELVPLSALPTAGERDGVLVDTLGELAALYGVADVAFVGGSLVPVGGHNLLEPAAFGVPVLFGPHTEHFESMAAELEARGGGARVADAAALGQAIAALLGDAGARLRMARGALSLIEASRGAVERSAELLEALG